MSTIQRPTTPREGLDRCDCGVKYWEGNNCIDCGERFRGRKCEQCRDSLAQCYAGGKGAGDWAGDYCYECVDRLGFRVWDHYE